MKSYRHLLLSLTLVSCIPVTYGQVTLNPSATRALGAARLEQLATLTNLQPNLVEGRELNTPQGIALDLSSTPIHLYVADSLNNRVLGWRDATTFNNGAIADLVIGQSDLLTTIAQGPGRNGSTRPSSGMTVPTGMTVDGTGNLYVVDSGNNRILRFPKPFDQKGDQFPDLVLGQQNFGSNTANSGGITASTLNFTAGGLLTAYLKFDNFNNLWVADTGNQRVLRYPASVITSTAANGAAADIVLGQPDFSTNTLLRYDPTTVNALYYPTGIAFDQTGRLFVTESQPSATIRSRILVFQPPYSSNQSAQRVIGTIQPGGTVQPPVISESQLANGAGGTFRVNNSIGVADTQNNRVLIYPPFEQFTSDILTQKAQVEIGQIDFLNGKPNRGNADADNNTLQAPSDAAFSGTELYIADGGNNRIIVMPVTPNATTLGFTNAVRLLGQQLFSEQSVNYIEGREFHFADSLGRADAGIAVDLQGGKSAPHLYIADTYNNRILCYVDYRTVKTGGLADFVIGQPDLFHSSVNYNPNSATSTSDTPTNVGLLHPTGVVVDQATGDLYVADSGNSRVLRFPSPFTQPTKQTQPANLVLGQSNFTTKITDVSGARMFQPYGLAWAPGTGLLVSDVIDNRVLLFAGPNFTNGQTAVTVWGQASFGTAAPGNADNRFSSPHGVAVDSNQRLYVVDSGNNRVLVFDDIRKAGPDPHSLTTIGGLTAPRAIFIDQYTPVGGTTALDEIWIGDSSRALRFAGGYDDLFTSNFTPDSIIPEAGGALALAVDSSSALYVADIANRVVIHYVDLAPLNAASYNTLRQTVAPNTIISVFSKGGQFGAATQAASSVPLPNTLQAIQVLLNGTPMPLYYVSPSQINFLVPNNAPSSGTADLQVLRTDNGQTLGDTTINMTTVSPGLFTMPGTGKGQVVALNDDGTANSPSNAISRSHTLQVFGTGVGFIQGAPSDGSAVSTATPTSAATTALINGVPCTVTYSGLAPNQVGVWQANVLIADAVVPTSSLANRTSELVISIAGTPSGGSGQFNIQVTVWVKQ